MLVVAWLLGPVANAVGQQPKPIQSESTRAPRRDKTDEKLAPERNRFQSWIESPTATGDWFDLRTALDNHGVRSHIYLNSQFQGLIDGGKGDTGVHHSASLDVIVTFDLGELGIIKDADLLVHVQSNFGEGINPRIGSDFQVNDDADGKHSIHVAQLWYRQHLADRRISLTLGYLDFQTIVDRNAFANSEDRQFMHQALDNNPIIPLAIGLGASLMIRPCEAYTITLGVADAQHVFFKPGFSTAFHDEAWWFTYMEHGLAIQFPSKRGPLAGNYRVGMIYDPRPRAIFTDPDAREDPRFKGDDYGFYVNFDQVVLRESPDDDQGLGVFGRFGYRTSETNRYARFYSAGLSYQGLIPGRDEDVLGFGFAMIEVSDDLRRRELRDADRETIYELYYAIRVTEWLTISPDVQYIDNPGATGEFTHALTAGVRARVSF
ncbi:MAG: carbohydrate porin [Planctomycetota bacterium]|jgi:porin